jgi:hypothetical protein
MENCGNARECVTEAHNYKKSLPFDFTGTMVNY